jgi:Mor family transcriptional regulator
MPITPLPLDFNYFPSFEIQTKHKEAIRQLDGFGGKITKELIARYKLTKLSIYYILSYNHLEHARPS